VSARAGVKPKTLRLKAIDSANAPSRPTVIVVDVVVVNSSRSGSSGCIVSRGSSSVVLVIK